MGYAEDSGVSPRQGLGTAGCGKLGGLNVAISRARPLAVVVASPQLLEIACQTIDQMRLLTTLCWVKAYAESQKR